ncbi:hypothetical protein F4777DRAFT_534366 [Nemania sp. FL0916]|nr:hypothetical protein F4777DRAFT_534366 [Nemania sp. FL0916]
MTDAQEPQVAESTGEMTAEPAAPIAEDESGDSAQVHITSTVGPSETAPLPAAEVLHDVQIRSQRSKTPPPADDAARKRSREDDPDTPDDAASSPPSKRHKTSRVEDEDAERAPTAGVDVKSVRDDENADQISERHGDEGSIAGHEMEDVRIAHSGSTNAEIDDSPLEAAKDRAMTDAATMGYERDMRPAEADTYHQDTRGSVRSPTPEPDIEPSLHPATCALYIKNFMRPLRPQAVQDHLLELATPTDAALDPNIITDFYLDTIRTHAFAVFVSVSAASRVRTALHKRVWPDETNRKALWIDFIPPECFDTWVNTEQQARDRGSMPRYEVVYNRDRDGNVIASLEETDANQSMRRAPVSPVVHPDRRPSIPSGPSRPSGIENAPTGPRNPYAHNGPAAPFSNRQERLEPGFLETKTGPPVLYRPVAPELARRRLELLAQAKDPFYNEESGRDYHRYYFEKDDVLVNRGPEIFLGIRPPHREKERRELVRAGIDPRDRNYRDRRAPLGPSGGGGGAGGQRRRRRNGPRPHGVPRGGDRFRPNSSYDDRSTFDDRRAPRYDNYGDNGRRNDGYRY